MSMLRVMTRTNEVWRRFLSPDGGDGAGGSDADSKPDGDRDDQKPKSDGTPDELAWLEAKDPAERLKKYNETTAGLRSALDAERKGRSDLERDVKALKKQIDSATDQQLENEKKFQQLADDRKKKLDVAISQVETLTQELEAAKTSYAQLEKIVLDDVTAEIEALALPKSVTELLDGKSPLERRRWLTEHRDEFRREPGDRTRRTPRSDNANMTETERAAKTARTW